MHSSLFGEHRFLCFAGERASFTPEIEPDNEIDGLHQELGDLMASKSQQDPRGEYFRQIEGPYTDATVDAQHELLQSIFGQHLVPGMQEPQIYGGTRPFSNAGNVFNPETGQFASANEAGHRFYVGNPPQPWDALHGLYADNHGVQPYSFFGPRVGPPHLPMPMASFYRGPNSMQYPDMRMMMRGMQQGQVRDSLDDLLENVFDRRGNEYANGRRGSYFLDPNGNRISDQEADRIYFRKNRERARRERQNEPEKKEKNGMSPEEKAKKKAELEKQMAPLKDKEVGLRAEIKKHAEGTPERTRIKEELAKVVEAIMGIAAQIQALEGEKNNPDGKPNT